MRRARRAPTAFQRRLRGLHERCAGWDELGAALGVTGRAARRWNSGERVPRGRYRVRLELLERAVQGGLLVFQAKRLTNVELTKRT